MDAARRLEVIRREHAVLIARTDQHLRDSGTHPLRSTLSRTALLVHRNEWFVSKVCSALAFHGCGVLPTLDNGADAVGFAAAEQPDFILVEDSLPMLPGEQAVREIRGLCPDAFIVAQVAYPARAGAFTDAGASAVVTRRVPPADVAAALLSLTG
jgi:DNA-binding NarL/FixJ family response regulator